MDSAIATPLNPDDPREIGQFKIIGLLGVGGMGEVYLGTADEGYVAVKRVRPRVVDHERFKREVGILHRVPIGVAPSVLASDSTVTRPWFATEYVPGVTVDDAVRLHGPLLPDTLWLLLAETSAQLRAVHEAKIVHRYFGVTHTQSTNPRAGVITHSTSTLVAGGHASSAPSSTVTASAKASASASANATSARSTLPSTAASTSEAAASSGKSAAVATTTTSTKAAATAVASPTSSSISAINGGDDTTQVPGSEADTDEMYGDAACSAWLDDNGSGDLAGVLNTSWDQSCVAELFRSDGVAYKFAASWAAEKTSFISDEGFTMWI